MRLAAACVLVLWSLSSAAGEMIIAGGGKTSAEGEAALKKFTAAATKEVSLSSGFPRLLESATVKGLKPGFHVVVLGVCGDRRSAQSVTRALAKTHPGAYVRTVEGGDLTTCPKVTATQPEQSPNETKLRARLQAEPGSAAVRYDLAYFLYTEGRLDEASAEVDALLEKHPEHEDGLALGRTISVLMMD